MALIKLQIKSLGAFDGFASSSGGSSDYNDLDNLPQVNGVTLQGNKTNIDLGTSKIVDVGTAQETYKTYVLPKISVEDALEAYNSFVSGTPTVLLWTIYGNPTYLNIISTDEVSGSCSIDVCLHNQFHISYKWDSDTEDFCTYEVNEAEYAQQTVIATTGTSGSFTSEQMALITNDSNNVLIENGGEYYSLKHNAINYKTYVNMNTPTDTTVTVKSIYVNISSGASNYGTWYKEDTTLSTNAWTPDNLVQSEHIKISQIINPEILDENALACYHLNSSTENLITGPNAVNLGNITNYFSSYLTTSPYWYNDTTTGIHYNAATFVNPANYSSYETVFGGLGSKIGQGDYTFEFRIKYQNENYHPNFTLYSNSDSSTSRMTLNFGFNKIEKQYAGSTGTLASGWHHFALVRKQGMIAPYCDGVRFVDPTVDDTVLNDLVIFANPSGSSTSYDLAEITLTKVAKWWGESFTVPTKPYALSSASSTYELNVSNVGLTYSTLPTASSSNEGTVVQYTGTTDSSYTNGYFYKCTAQGTTPETYAWVQTNVQPASEPTVVTLTTDSTTLANNTIFNGDELATVSLVAPSSMTAAFTSQVNFSSGSTATTFTLSNVYMRGDDCTSGTFTPVASKRYSILFMYNGIELIGFVCGK